MREDHGGDDILKSDMPKPANKVAFIDLQAQRRRLGQKIDDALARVLEHGRFVMGPEIESCERDLAEFCGARHAVTCGSGTQALHMAMRALGVASGDAVFVPAFTFVAPAEVVALIGATPVFVDVRENDFNMDPVSLEAAITTARHQGLNPVGIVPVDLFGQPADYPAITAIAEKHGLFVLGDAAQSFGATLDGAGVGTLAKVTTTSFFPAKPLGTYGDGGAIFTHDAELADVLRSIRNHGAGNDRYDHVRIGETGRLDTMQAAILIEKLLIFADEIAARQQISERYTAGLSDLVRVPRLNDGATSVWAQYTIIIDDHDRDAAVARLREANVPTAIYYQATLHEQEAYRAFPVAGNGLPVAESLTGRVLSLPMHPYLDEKTQDWIINSVRLALGDG